MMLRQPKSISGLWAKRGGLRKMVLLKFYLFSMAFKINFMSWDTDLGSY